jgi:O-antigen/teichoic acid export membrane protein
MQITVIADTTVFPTKEIRALALRLMRGSLIYVLANFGIRALNFFLFPLYTHFLSPADYGIVSLAETVAAVLMAVFSLGLDAGVRRLYFQYVSDPKKLKRYVSTILRFAAISTLLAVSAALFLGQHLLAWAAPHFSVPFYPYIAMATTTAALLQIVQYRLSLYQIQERARSFGLLSLGVFLATAVAVMALVVFVRWGAMGMLLGKLLAAALATLGAVYLLRAWFRAPLEWEFVRETLPLSLPLVPHGLMALCLVAADRFILEHYRSLQEVGLYSLAYTLGMAMYLVASSLAQAWQPIYFDTARTGGNGGRHILAKLSSGMAVLLIAVAIFGIQIAQDFTHLLDPRYSPVGRLIPWIIGGYLLHAFFGLFHLALMEGKKTKFILFASAAAFALNLALNLWWVPLLGMYGAAYATFVAYGGEALLTYFYAQRVFFLPYEWGRIFAALSLLAVVIGVSQFNWRGYVHMLATIGTLLSTMTMVWFFGGRTVGQIFKHVLNGKTS